MTTATTKIGFFIAGTKPTTQEAADILIMQNLGFNVAVRSALNYVPATSDEPEQFAYVMDSASGANIPTDYADTNDFPRASKTQPPAPDVLSTQKVITSGVEFLSPAVSGSRTDGYTPTIVAGAVTALAGS